MKSVEQVNALTLDEYYLLCEAHALNEERRVYDMHLNAWLNYIVQAEKEVGKGKNKKVVPMFKSFDEFYKGAKKQDKKDSKLDKEFIQLVIQANK